MNWSDLLPQAVAAEQIAWERSRRAARARAAGLTLKRVGNLFGVSVERARQLVDQGKQYPVSPVARWMHHGGEIAALAARLARLRRTRDAG